MPGDDRRTSPRRRRLWPIGLGVAVALAAGAALAPACPAYVRQAMANPWMPVLAAVGLGCLLVLALLGRALWLAGAAGRARPQTGQEGQAILEFALVMPILLMIVLVMIQVALMMGSLVNLHYSAYCAARAGVVAVPLQTDSEGENQMSNFEASAWRKGSAEKIQRVYTAAVWALIPYSCGSPDIAQASDGVELEADLGRIFSDYGVDQPAWIADYMGRKLAYARDHTRVRVEPPQPAGAEIFRVSEDIHVTVEHDMYLGVPYANRLFSTVVGGKSLGNGHYAVEMTVESRLNNEGLQDFIDVEEFPRPDAPPIVVPPVVPVISGVNGPGAGPAMAAGIGPKNTNGTNTSEWHE